MLLLGACGRWGGGKRRHRGLSRWLVDLQFILRRTAAKDKQLAVPTANAYGAAGPSTAHCRAVCFEAEVGLRWGFVSSRTACKDTKAETYGLQVCLFVGHFDFATNVRVEDSSWEFLPTYCC